MFGLRLLWRDWRGGELGILASALVMAVAIVTGISLFADRLQQGIVAQSSTFLAADRVLQSPRAIKPHWLDQARSLGLQQAQVLGFQSMVFAGDDMDSAMQIASVKAVSNNYPLHGVLEVSDEAFTTSFNISNGPKAGEVWLDPRLLPLMNIDLGDSLNVGEAKLTVTKVIVNEPDRGGNVFAFGPRVMMNIYDIPATKIVQPGSRVEFRYLFAGDAELLKKYGAWLKSRMEPSHKWLNLKDSQPRIAQSLERAEQFLLLAGALGVGLAGIAIALAARRYSERHYDYVAMMKSLGATSVRVMVIYSLNLLVLGFIAMLVGCGVGWMIQEVFIRVLQSYFEVASVPDITLRPFIIGSVTALVCLLAFALPPLLSLQRASPLSVLRRDIPHSGLSNLITYGMGVLGIALLMYWYSGNLILTLVVLCGVGLTFIIVGLFAWYLLRGTTKVGMQAGSSWRLALASMRRRGFQNAVQSVIFSLSIMLLLMLALVRSSLIEEWQVQLPEGTPNHFLINVAERDVDSLSNLLLENKLQSEPIYPMVRGRLTLINGDTVKSRVSELDPSAENSLDRELSLSWSDTKPLDNELLAGQWWQPGSTDHELSIESVLAKRLGITLGDQLQFQIGSEILIVTVTSIRKLDWDTMKPNFYMLFPAEILKQYPATFMTSFYLPPDKKYFLNSFLRDFPTVTVIEMDSVIKQIRTIINQVSSAIELVLGLIIISGLLVLIASVQASLDSRFQESAILRTLGAKRGLVLGSLAIEFSSLGCLAGFLAAFSAELCVYGLQEFLLGMTYVPHPWVWLVGPIIGGVLIGSAGFITCRKVVNTPPVDILRDL
jgi:putative ABC transport system permease protein